MNQVMPLHWWPESCDIEDEATTGEPLRRVSAAPAITDNIYHEQPRNSADGNRLALSRTFDGSRRAPCDLLVYDIDRYRLAYLERASSDGKRGVLAIATSSWSGQLIVLRQDGSRRIVVRFDLNTLESEEIFDWGDLPGGGFHSISPDGRWGLASGRIEKRTFGVYRVDLENAQCELIHENEHLCNPHLQFCLRDGGRILVQENRGCRLDENDNVILPFDERGVGLYTIGLDGGDRRDFPVGPPLSANTTGHECWIGDTDRALVTLAATYDDGERCGNVLEVSHDWEKPRVVFDSPLIWNHVVASRCGRYFIADSYTDRKVPILIGNIQNGKTKILCDSLTSGGGAQYMHAHPYLTSDNRWVVFNSDRTGLPQVYLAKVTDEFFGELE